MLTFLVPRNQKFIFFTKAPTEISVASTRTWRARRNSSQKP